MVSFELRLGQKEITYFFSLLVNQYIDPPPKKKKLNIIAMSLCWLVT